MSTLNAIDILKERGFLYQSTDLEALEKHLDTEKPVTFYVGFDPTADSLHVGHLLPVMAMRWLQQCGHRAIALVGGGTAMVGDPSGKTEARPVLSTEDIAANAESIRQQMMRFLDFSNDRALLLNNADWLADLNYIEFLRDIGRHFSVNRMLAAESVKMRLETGLSFLEFNYMLLQAYDFYVLCRDQDCTLQLGGQDQWGNIVAGIDLTRRMMQREVHGVTFPLLLKADGEKFGKTAAGAVWLDSVRTSPYAYYQFWRNVEDIDVERLMLLFTLLDAAEVKRLASLQPPQLNRAKEILAFEATALAHGPEEARKSYVAAGSQFGFADPDGQIETTSQVRHVTVAEQTEDLPTHTVMISDLKNGIWIVQLLVDAGLCSSKGDARRLIRGGGCYVDDDRITDEKALIDDTRLDSGQMILRAGKKKVRRIVAT